MLYYSLLRASHNHGHLWWTKCASWLLTTHLLATKFLHLIYFVGLLGFCFLWLYLQDVSFQLLISCHKHEFLESIGLVFEHNSEVMVSYNHRAWDDSLGLTLICDHILDKSEQRKFQRQSFYFSSLKACQLQSMFLI